MLTATVDGILLRRPLTAMGFGHNSLDLARVVFICILSISVIQAVDTNGYFGDERNGLIQFRDSMHSSYDLHGNWTGPPCYDNQSRWAGIVCSNWRVIHIVLDGLNLSGSLPPTFLNNITFLTKLSLSNNSISGNLPILTSLVNLELLLLSNNQFSGIIPSGYTSLPKLRKVELQINGLSGHIPPFNQRSLTDFNVSYNKLSGQIPENSVLQTFPRSSFDHNAGLCGEPLGIPCPVSPPSPIAPSPNNRPAGKGKKGILRVWVIVLIAAAGAFIPLFVMLVFLCYYRKVQVKEAKEDHYAGRRNKEGMEKATHWSTSTEDPERTVELEFFDKDKPQFDLDDLLRASAEVLGKGKLSTTYKAMLELGPAVAVKRLKDMNTLSKKEFIQQIQLLGKLRHQNLVEVISFYYSKEEKLVISGFVEGGNLFELLHDNRGMGRAPLDWKTRISIIKDVAKGLSFLRQSLSTQKVPHGNLKSSNVLIQNNNEGLYQSAKLSDFGFLPLLPSRRSSQKMAIGKSPEFVQGKKLTHKADVYCFGVLVLEVITGRIPGELHDDLSDWVKTAVNNEWSMDILDMEILQEKEGHEEMLKLTELAIECTDEEPERRPKMGHVLMRLEDIYPQVGPEQKPNNLREK